MKEQASILIRCAGSARIGFGHLMRCQSLAAELRALDCQVAFLVREGTEAIDKLRQDKYPVFSAGFRPFDYRDWLLQAVERTSADALIVDSRDMLPGEALRRIKDCGTLVAAIDDPDPSRLRADMAFHPPVPQLAEDGRGESTGEIYTGWEWVILGGNFTVVPPRPAKDPLRVLVTMGGSDTPGLTFKAIRALESLSSRFAATVVVGPGFSRGNELNSLLTRTRRSYELLRDINDMADVMAGTDLAVASFGVTAYELAAMGVPAIHMCLTADHEQSSSAFVSSGMAHSVGLYDQVSHTRLAAAIRTLLEDEKARQRMSQQSLQRLDGKGAGRIARRLVERIGKDRLLRTPPSQPACTTGRSFAQADTDSGRAPNPKNRSSTLSKTSRLFRLVPRTEPRI